jgi:GxxExxY protein
MDNLTQRDPRTYKIIGAAMEVHRQLGCGFLEPVYQEAMALELKNRGIPYSQELLFPINYKGNHLRHRYRPDFICFDGVIVEVKALSRLSSVEESQVINYLKVTGYHTGLLLNFGARSLEKRRFVLD